MNLNKYQELALRTAPAKDYRMTNKDLTHAAYGLASETGEFADNLKKHEFYYQKFDRDNAIEELGDIMWYVALAARGLDIDLDTIATVNIQKLKVRYPDKFTAEHAKERLDKK